MPSKALEINLASSRVDVGISDEYRVLQDVMSRYHGIKEGLNTFLKEISHPYRNWEFIVREARRYALDYFHVLKTHPKGPEAAKSYVDIFLQAISTTRQGDVRADAADNLLLYLQEIIKNSGKELPRFIPILNHGFDLIRSYGTGNFFLFVKSFYALNRLAKAILEKAPPETDFDPINSLLLRYLQCSYSCWLGEEDPLAWFNKEAGDTAGGDTKELKEIFYPISHAQLRAYQDQIESGLQLPDQDSKLLLDTLSLLPGYAQIVERYSEIPGKLLKAGQETGQGRYWKLIFLFHIMKTRGLSSIHEVTLRDINRTLTWFIGNERPQAIKRLILKTFHTLKVCTEKYPGTALNSVLNMGEAVYKTDESDLVDFFIDHVVALGFQAPELNGVGDDWQMRANSAHIQNIRTWLQLIELNPKWSKKLLSSLIIHLSLSGVFIRDTDLFPRDITRFLNSDIGPVYNLAKQLTRLFPAYFNDIGSEGRLRDISTRMDEISFRKDVLIHFLRKQSHVESSNQILGLMEATLNFWRAKEKEGLKPFVPPIIYEQIETEGPYADGAHKIMTHLFKERRMNEVRELLMAGEIDLKEMVKGVSGIPDADVERVQLAITFYKLLNQKYNLGFMEVDNCLRLLRPEAFPELDKLKEALSEPYSKKKLSRLLDYLEGLKELILSSRRYEIREDIYRKRHFAVDIPSMYGSYYEMKFDALGLTFRLESLVNILFEELVEEIDLEVITRDTFIQIHDYLLLFYRALKLDGIISSQMQRQLDLLAHSLEVRGFSYTQFLDIFRGFSLAVRNIVNDHFNSAHQQNIIKILGQLPPESLLSKYRPRDGVFDQEEFIHRVSEVFLREKIASSLGLQQLDLFLGRIMNILFQQSDKLPREELRLLLNFDPQKAVTPISPVNQKVSDIIYLGNKGLNLVRLRGYGFPVPPGFIITTEIFRCRQIIDHYPPADQNLKEQVAREVFGLERLTGRSFGDPRNPLLLSVRSGAPISQPGMMDTFLDVGMNGGIVQGIIALTKQQWFAWDCYRRFLQSYGMAFGLKRDDFDAIISEHKQALGVSYKKEFTGEQMKRVTLAYKEFIRENGIRIEESPFKQLYVAIRRVLDSWDSPKAKTYRKIMGISDDWGTAVTVQQMVFGNLSQQSGSGVVFTQYPRWSGDVVRLWGDFTIGNQGEDVVSGLVKTLPISNQQAEVENRKNQITLEAHFPEIYHTVRDAAKDLIYDRKWVPQEMEFTFEGPLKEDLYFLQTRDMAVRERKRVLSFVTPHDTEARLIGHGIGVSGGAMTGRVVHTVEEIRQWREVEPQTSLILVRGDTVPDDIKEIYEADGLLTARGGSTSHAAIVAHRLGKTSVVGCANLICMEKESRCSFDHVSLRSGDWISIDGQEGSIYSGKMKIKETVR